MFRKLIALLLCICTLGSMTVYAVDDVTEPTVPETTQAAEATTPVEDPSTPAESTPAESTPVESTPTESTPAESTPTESTPAESTPTESTPEDGEENGLVDGEIIITDPFGDESEEVEDNVDVAAEAGDYIRPVAFTEAGPLLIQRQQPMLMRAVKAASSSVDTKELHYP